MTDEEYKADMQKFEIERRKRETETKRILFDKLEEMAKIQLNDCDYNEYPEICKAMNEIAKTILGIA